MMKNKIGTLLLLSLMAGCKQVDLFHNLQEIEAGEIMVTLQQNSIEAVKEKEMNGQDVSWKITVGEKDVPRARQILVSNNLPREKALGLSGVYKEKGLIPTPDEQKARFLLALKGEIINSLLKIPGVVDADVVLNVPHDSEFADLDPVKKRPTASVVVRTKNEELVAQTVTESKMQRFVANTVPNMDPNDVAVIVTRSDTGASQQATQAAAASQAPVVYPVPAHPMGIPVGHEKAENADGEEAFGENQPKGGTVEIAGLELSQESVGRFKAYFIGILSLLVAVSVFLLFNILRLNRMRLKVQKGSLEAQNILGEGGTQSLLGEGQNQGAQGSMTGGNLQGMENTYNTKATPGG